MNVKLLAAVLTLAAVSVLADPPANTANGLRVTLSADKAEASAGESVAFALTFENVSEADLRVFWPVDLLVTDHVQLRVTGPDVVRNLIKRPPVIFIPVEANFPTLKSGEKKTYPLTLAGNPPAFAPFGLILAAPGVYRVQAIYRFRGLGPEEQPPAGGKPFAPWTGTLETNPVEIKFVGEFLPARPPELRMDPGPLMMPDGGELLPSPMVPLPDTSLPNPARPSQVPGGKAR